MKSRSRRVDRRRFLSAATTGAAAGMAAPTLLLARRTSTEVIVGEGDHRYRVRHNWPQLPARYTWQTTHNVAVDREQNLYVIHEGRFEQADHPSIFVFDAEGKFVRAFGQQFQGGGHGIEVRQEGGEQFLYVCAYQMRKTFAKLTLTGETVWQKFAPMDSGVYAAGEDVKPEKIWGRDRFLPTNFAFLADGGFLLADGYGSYFIHRYDRDGNWLSKFGGPGAGAGTFDTPHGIWLDNRGSSEPTVVVCDRAHHAVQLLTLDGRHLKTLTGYGLPANVDSWRDLLLVPELHARVTILNARNEVVARLGDDVARVTGEGGNKIRGNPDQWLDGKFVHPHDACFDADGDIFVAEWVGTGRVSKLERVA